MITKPCTRVQSLCNPDLVPFTSSYASTNSPGHIKNDAMHISRESPRFIQLWSISAMILKPIQSPHPHTAESQIPPYHPFRHPHNRHLVRIPGVAEPEPGCIRRQPPSREWLIAIFRFLPRPAHGAQQCSQNPTPHHAILPGSGAQDAPQSRYRPAH